MDREKRDIRIVFLVFSLIFGVLAKKTYPSSTSYAFISSAFCLLFILVFYPLTLRPLFSRWMKFAHFMGRINTQILIFVIFILIFIPAGVLLRLLGKDPMRRQFDKRCRSYWEKYEISGVKDRQRYERQF